MKYNYEKEDIMICENFNEEFINDELHKRVSFFEILTENNEKTVKDSMFTSLSSDNSNNLYHHDTYGSLFNREYEIDSCYIKIVALVQQEDPVETALQVKVPKLLKEMDRFYNKNIYTALTKAENNVEKSVNWDETINFSDDSCATDIYLNGNQFSKLRKQLKDKKVNTEVTYNCIEYHGVKYHNLLEAVPKDKYIALNKYHSPAVINNLIKLKKYNECDRIDCHFQFEITVHDPEFIIHGNITNLS